MAIVDEQINVLGVWISESEKKLYELNYQPLLKKAKGILERWKNRNLSLFAKITVVNTLIVSQFIYKMAVLPNLPDQFIKAFEKIINEFLWNARRPKISLNVLYADKQSGGAGLIDLRKKDKAMKLGWVKTILSDPSIASMAYKAMENNKVGDLIWKCNISVKDAKCTFKASFWNDILKAWSVCNFSEPKNVHEIRNQIIWYNSHLKIAGKVFCFKKAVKAGLQIISQLLTPEGKIIDYVNACEMFDLDILQYNGIIKAIPVEWKKIMFNEAKSVKANDSGKYLIDEISTCKKMTQKGYKLLNKVGNVAFKAYCKWQVKLHTNMSYNDFLKLFKVMYGTTNHVQLRSFHFRFLHYTIILNDKLKIWNIVDSDLCTNCGECVENVIHFFAECTKARKMYEYLEFFLEIECNFSGQLIWSTENIMFNKIHENPKNIANFLLLITKHYLYSSRCRKIQPNVAALYEFIENARRCEYYNAKCTNQVSKHVKKWYENNQSPDHNAHKIEECINEMYMEM